MTKLKGWSKIDSSKLIKLFNKLFRERKKKNIIILLTNRKFSNNSLSTL